MGASNFPSSLAHNLGVKILLTNAAGGIRKDLEPGDLMVLSDPSISWEITR